MQGRVLFKTILTCDSLVVLAVMLFLVIPHFGESLTAPAAALPEPTAESTAKTPDALLHVLLALAAVIIVGQILAKLFTYIRQPPVIGEVVAGILLGPSLIGTKASAWILPPMVAPYLGVIAQIGVILFMFLVGLELNAGLLRDRVQAVAATSIAGIVIPFVSGALLALVLYPRLATEDVPFTTFALFIGLSLSVTAFPVLARILSDWRMTRTRLGMSALVCAAVNDAAAWCLLAFVVGMARAQVGSVLWVIAGAAVYLAVMLLVVRPVVNRYLSRLRPAEPSRSLFAAVFAALLLSALATEAIGIHAIFGAFMLGAVIPYDSALAKSLNRQLHHVVTALLLPAFFVYTGMRTRIDLLSSANQWLICLAIVIVATLGKFGGTVVAARLTGISWRDASILGTLMNTRGLMELIVLNVGLDLKVISPTLFAMMVIMALATTMVTSPVLWLLKPETERSPATETKAGFE
jgi:Kef-type K+ transport system membrane component KefB